MMTHHWTASQLTNLDVTAGTDGGNGNDARSLIRLDNNGSNHLAVSVNGGEPVELRSLEVGIHGAWERMAMLEALRYALSILDGRGDDTMPDDAA